MRFRTAFIALLLVLCGTMAIDQDAFAKGRSSGGSRSSFRSSRPSSPSRSKSNSSKKSSATQTRSRSGNSNSSKPRPLRSTPSKGTSAYKSPAKTPPGQPRYNPSHKPSTRKEAASMQKQHQASQTRYQAAKRNGKHFKDSKGAKSDFKAKHGKQYPSKYDKKPATRPKHIPESTQVGGKTVNITYNQAGGGYGYYGGGGPGLGTFIMYSMMADAVMSNRMMNNHGYYVGSAPVAPMAYVAPRGHSGIWATLVCIIVIVLVVYFVATKPWRC